MPGAGITANIRPVPSYTVMLIPLAMSYTCAPEALLQRMFPLPSSQMPRTPASSTWSSSLPSKSISYSPAVPPPALENPAA